MFESRAGILWIAGLGFFAFAFLSNAIVPMAMYKNNPELTAEEVVNPRLMFQFKDLHRRYPEQFEKYYGQPTEENCAKALRLGRQVYIGEGCWHCHSQFVRPVSNESRRWGPVAETKEFNNELQRPVMFGTRRVGPDLSRQGGRHGNDWHTVHFHKPSVVSTGSPMPEYPWFFDEKNPDKPNERGIAIITYVQWLGSWLPEYPYYEELEDIRREEQP
jgi:cytochrome c oxidase cbb3-type subunit II